MSNGRKLRGRAPVVVEINGVAVGDLMRVCRECRSAEMQVGWCSCCGEISQYCGACSAVYVVQADDAD
jgi:hypothetical protein